MLTREQHEELSKLFFDFAEHRFWVGANVSDDDRIRHQQESDTTRNQFLELLLDLTDPAAKAAMAADYIAEIRAEQAQT